MISKLFLRGGKGSKELLSRPSFNFKEKTVLQCQHVEYGSHEDNRSLAGEKNGKERAGKWPKD